MKNQIIPADTCIANSPRWVLGKRLTDNTTVFLARWISTQIQHSTNSLKEAMRFTTRRRAAAVMDELQLGKEWRVLETRM
jgi:hypothetical protein